MAGRKSSKSVRFNVHAPSFVPNRQAEETSNIESAVAEDTSRPRPSIYTYDTTLRPPPGSYDQNESLSTVSEEEEEDVLCMTPSPTITSPLLGHFCHHSNEVATSSRSQEQESQEEMGATQVEQTRAHGPAYGWSRYTRGHLEAEEKLREWWQSFRRWYSGPNDNSPAEPDSEIVEDLERASRQSSDDSSASTVREKLAEMIKKTASKLPGLGGTSVKSCKKAARILLSTGKWLCFGMSFIVAVAFLGFGVHMLSEIARRRRGQWEDRETHK